MLYFELEVAKCQADVDPLEPERTGSLCNDCRDINGFTRLVNTYEDTSIAQFTRDLLVKGINLVEQQGVMLSDSWAMFFYALLPEAKSVYDSSWVIRRR